MHKSILKRFKTRRIEGVPFLDSDSIDKTLKKLAEAYRESGDAIFNDGDLSIVCEGRGRMAVLADKIIMLGLPLERVSFIDPHSYEFMKLTPRIIKDVVLN